MQKLSLTLDIPLELILDSLRNKEYQLAPSKVELWHLQPVLLSHKNKLVLKVPILYRINEKCCRVFPQFKIACFFSENNELKNIEVLHGSYQQGFKFSTINSLLTSQNEIVRKLAKVSNEQEVIFKDYTPAHFYRTIDELANDVEKQYKITKVGRITNKGFLQIIKKNYLYNYRVFLQEKNKTEIFLELSTILNWINELPEIPFELRIIQHNSTLVSIEQPTLLRTPHIFFLGTRFRSLSKVTLEELKETVKFFLERQNYFLIFKSQLEKLAELFDKYPYSSLSLSDEKDLFEINCNHVGPISAFSKVKLKIPEVKQELDNLIQILAKSVKVE